MHDIVVLLIIKSCHMVSYLKKNANSFSLNDKISLIYLFINQYHTSSQTTASNNHIHTGNLRQELPVEQSNHHITLRFVNHKFEEKYDASTNVMQNSISYVSITFRKLHTMMTTINLSVINSK